MTTNINLNLNQSPYFDDYDEAKDFHQILYKPAVAVQARELTQDQTILRNQVKRFGDHVFANGSRVSGGNLHIDIQYSYVKLNANYNGAAITPANLLGKTIVGTQSGTTARVVNTAAINATTGDPDTIWVKYLTGGGVTQKVQGVAVTNAGTGYTSAPTVTLTGGGGTGAVAVAVVGADQTIIGINITAAGSGYTSAPTVAITGGGGANAAASSTLNTSAIFNAGERLVATDLSSAVLVASGSATGYGSAIHNDEGYYYFNGNFIRAAAGSLVLDNYTATPSYKIGFQVTAAVAASGDDSSLLDNAQGAYNYAAPGADRLKYTLTLTKKATDSTDDTDFIEVLRIVNGVRHIDNSYAIYSELEETFARRTFDESGSYTVRHFPLQLKNHGSDATKFIARLDPGKAYILGHEFTTLVSADVNVDRARTSNEVSNFDRLMQYGNYTNVTTVKGMFDTTSNAIVDLHNLPVEAVSPTSPTTYGNSKIGTAKVRQLNYVSGTTPVLQRKYRMYLYDIQLTAGDFGDVESIIIPESPLSGTIVFDSHANVDITGHVGGSPGTIGSVKVFAGGTGYTSAPIVTFSGGGATTQATGVATVAGNAVTAVTVTTPGAGYTSPPTISFSGGGGSSAIAYPMYSSDSRLFDTDFNTMVFKLPQNTIKTVRDGSNNIDTSYQIQRVFSSVQITAGSCVLTSGGSGETFFGTGVLSDTNKLGHYHATVKTAGNSGLSVGDIIDYRDAVSGVVTVAGNGQSVTLNTGQNHTFTADFVATMNLDAKQEKTKTLVKNGTTAIASPNTTALSYDSISKSDINSIKAIYDSGSSSTDAEPPTLTVSGASGTFLAGETITGGTSGAKGTVIAHSPATTITFVVTSGTFAGTETITGGTNSYTATMSALAAGDTEISSRYTLDNGQRDNFYDHGRIQLAGTAPTGRILVVADYFSHNGSGYFSVDSYTSSGLTDPYVDIPSFTSPTSGLKLELRDCIDFRPRRADGGTAMQNSEIPYPNTNWQADYQYYQPRIDTIYLGKDKKFGVHKGVPSDSPVAPYRLDATMNLWELKIPSYTFKPTDVTAVYLENKRYTMKDIGKMEKRLNNVEYYTALSLLEKDAEALVIKDAAGLERFKNGILVDDFAGHSVGDVFSQDYKCAVDFQNRLLRPPFFSNLSNLTYASGSSTGVAQTGALITLPFTSTEFISQTQATTFVSVNPYDVQHWQGVIDLNPPSDIWVAKNNRPDVIVNATGENDAWEALAGLGWGSQWNDWQDVGTGRNERVISRGEANWQGRALVQRQTFAVDQLQSRNGIRTEIVGSDTVNQSLGERVVDLSIMPFIRAQTITVTATGLKPNTRVYPFFDKTAISTYCTPSGGSAGDAIYTDDAGSISGLVFNLPCPDFALEQDPQLLVFRTGERQFLLTDDVNGDLQTANTFADSMFQAQGLLQTNENVILSSRVPRLHVGDMGSAEEAIVTTRRFDRDVVIGWAAPPRRDPLAQSFVVDAGLYPDGVYISDVDLYFKSKDTGNIPVNISIRSTEAGFPTQLVAPFSDVSKSPSQINTSNDGSVATNWAFPSPVYLAPGEYALVVLSNSSAYECFLAQLGQNILGSTRKVSKQPATGVLFKSQNASTWQQDQNQDLTFKINRCKFTISGTHEAVFQNVTPTTMKMDVMQLSTQEVIPDTTNLTWAVRTTDQSQNVLSSSYANLVQNKNQAFDDQQHITTTAGSFLARATLTSTNEHITPVIDTGRMGVIAVENIINNDTTDEADKASGGNATAKYISRRVTLTDGFDASDLTVYLTMNKPAGTNVYVYYKILSAYDAASFDDRPWKLMLQTTQMNTVALTDDEMTEYQFDPSATTIEYVDGSVTYKTFKTFAIKIVMTSTNTTKVPRIQDMRAIAMA